ncbi:MAG: hypothetical protein GTO14_01670 [Anaerolineales bacterium]|nr:hypothetical protein [Anaerolineales bacterium]
MKKIVMDIKFIIGGYYLVQGTETEEWMDSRFIPTPFWSVSSHLCEIFPDTWILGWNNDSESDKYRRLLGLDEIAFQHLQAEFTSLFEQGSFGFPNVFFNPEIALDFHSQYLSHLSHLKLLSIALDEKYWASFIEENEPHQGTGESGIRAMLRARKIYSDQGRFRGFEVLGFDGANFCSFVCNSLEIDFHQKLEIVFNPNGLIGDYEMAKRAATYTMKPEVGAEPYVWHPWRITEHSLEE